MQTTPMIRLPSSLLVSGCAALLLLLASPLARGADDGYTKTVEPILKERCYSCHGAKRQKGGLRLDSPEAILKGGKGGPAVVAGDAAKSPIWVRTTMQAGEDDVMPPKGDLLTKEQTDAIAAWIKAGAAAPGAAAKTDPPAKSDKPATSDDPAMDDKPKPGDKGKADDKPKPDDKQPDGKKPEGNVSPDVKQLKPDEKKALAPLPPTDLDALSQGVKAPDAKLLESLATLGVKSKPLSANGALIELDYSQVAGPVSADQLKPLAQLAENVVWLSFAGAQLTDRDLTHLDGLRKLERLHLEKTQITDKGLAHVGGLSELQYLNLVSTAVTDDGIAQLAGLKKLRTLYLWQSKATADGVAKLTAADPDLKVSLGEELPEAADPEAAGASKRKGGKKKK